MFTAFLVAVLFGTTLALLALLVAGPSSVPDAGAPVAHRSGLPVTLVSLMLILTTLALAQMVLA